MLPLDSGQWSDLHHAYGSGSDIPALLLKLLKHADPNTPENDDVWGEIWETLCHQGVVGSASYAAIPYIVEVAAQQPLNGRLDYLRFVGHVEVYRVIGPDPTVPDFLQTAYFAAHEHATKLILECLESNWSEDEIRSLLGTIAILRGHHPLGAAVSWLYHTATCPICTTKFPTQGYSWFREYQIIDIGIREFNINSSQYRRWITENPLGFVLKMPTQLPAKHLIVHRSGCEALHHTSEQDRLNVEKVVCIPDKQRFWEWKSKYDLYGRDSVRECGVCTMNE